MKGKDNQDGKRTRFIETDGKNNLSLFIDPETKMGDGWVYACIRSEDEDGNVILSHHYLGSNQAIKVTQDFPRRPKGLHDPYPVEDMNIDQVNTFAKILRTIKALEAPDASKTSLRRDP